VDSAHLEPSPGISGISRILMLNGKYQSMHAKANIIIYKDCVKSTMLGLKGGKRTVKN
jgi:hypothetical protein